MSSIDVNSVTASLNTLQFSELTTMSTSSIHHTVSLGRQTRPSTMNVPVGVLGKQGNQNAAALAPEEGIGKPRELCNLQIHEENGQRRYGPPRTWRSDPPQRGCEVFIGKIPRDCLENELIPVFEKIGPIYMFRLMMEFGGSNRGFAFCVYTNREDAKSAVQELDNFEIRKGKTIGVCISVDNCRLFVGGIPKSKTREEIMTEMKRVTEGVKDVICYPSVNDKSKNRGFAFVEYENHKAAAMARRKLLPGRIQLWNQMIAVDWAEPEREVNEDIMSKVKILYVRNLMLTTTEESLRESFLQVAGDPNCIERVKKINDYAFIHFKEREQAGTCLVALNDTTIDGSRIEVTWAKPVDRTEANVRPQSNHQQVRLLTDLPLGRDLRVNNPLLADPVSNAFATYLEPTLSYLLSPVGQHPSAPVSDLLTMNSSNIPPQAIPLGMNNTSCTRLNATRTGRRSAAGSRSAGLQRDRKHPIEKLQQRQLHPFSYYELLEEHSRNAGWGEPSFTVLPIEFEDNTTGNKFPAYIGQVLLPNLRLRYQTTSLHPTPEEAKIAVCLMALMNSQYNPILQTEDLSSITTLREPVVPAFLASSEGLINGQTPIPPQSVVPIACSSQLNNNSSMVTTATYPQLPVTSMSNEHYVSLPNLEVGHSQTIGSRSDSTEAYMYNKLGQQSGAMSNPNSYITNIATTTHQGQFNTNNGAYAPCHAMTNRFPLERVNASAAGTTLGSSSMFLTNQSAMGVTPSSICPVTHMFYHTTPQVPSQLTSCAGCYSVAPTATQLAYPSLQAMKTISTAPIPTMQTATYSAYPAFTTNYALNMASNAYLPVAFPPTGPNSNNPLGALMSAQSNGIPMPGSMSQSLGQPSPLGMNSPPDYPTMDYNPPFLPASLATSGLMAPFTNSATYLMDPTAPSMMMGGSNGNNGLTAGGLSSMVNITQSSVNGSLDLLHNPALGQPSQLSTAHIPHTGLYTLGLHGPTLATAPSQLTTSSVVNQNSLFGLFPQQPTCTTTAVSGSQSLTTPVVSLTAAAAAQAQAQAHAAQSLATQASQPCLSVPVPV